LLQKISQRRFKHCGAWSLSLFPTPHGLDVLANVIGNLTLGESIASLLK